MVGFFLTIEITVNFKFLCLFLVVSQFLNNLMFPKYYVIIAETQGETFSSK